MSKYADYLKSKEKRVPIDETRSILEKDNSRPVKSSYANYLREREGQSPIDPDAYSRKLIESASANKNLGRVLPEEDSRNRAAEILKSQSEQKKYVDTTSRIEARTEKPVQRVGQVDRKKGQTATNRYNDWANPPEYREDSGLDRIKLKYRIGELNDALGLAGSKAMDTGNDRDFRAKAAEMDTLIKKYPWIQSEPEAKNWGEKIGRFIGGATEATAEMLPTMINAQISGAKMGVPAALGGMATAGIAGQLGPQVAIPEEIISVPAAGIAGYKIGSTAGTAMHMFNVERGHAYQAMIQDGIAPEVATVWANVVGTANAGLELAQLGTLAKSVKGLDTALKTVKNAPIGRYLNKIGQTHLGKLGISVATETGQEVLQEAVGILGEAGSNIQSGRDYEINSPENRERLWQTAVQSAKAFLVLQGGGQMAGGTYRAAFNQSKKDVITAVNEFNNIQNPTKQDVEQLSIFQQEIADLAEQTQEPFFSDAVQKIEQAKTRLYRGTMNVAPMDNTGRYSLPQFPQQNANVGTSVLPKENVAQNANMGQIEPYAPKEPKVVSAKFGVREEPIAKSAAVGEFSKGDKLVTSKYGPVTVTDTSDTAFVKVKNQNGAEITVGRKALMDMVNSNAETTTEAVPFLSESEIDELLGNTEQTKPKNNVDSILKSISEFNKDIELRGDTNVSGEHGFIEEADQEFLDKHYAEIYDVITNAPAEEQQRIADKMFKVIGVDDTANFFAEYDLADVYDHIELPKETKQPATKKQTVKAKVILDNTGKEVDSEISNRLKDSKAKQKGALVRVYHGTRGGNFEQFSMDPFGTYAESYQNRLKEYQEGKRSSAPLPPKMPEFYFSDNKEVARTYSTPHDAPGSFIGEYFLDFKNPKIIDMKGKSFHDNAAKLRMADVVSKARKDGFDSVIMKNILDSRSYGDDVSLGTNYVAFNSNQIIRADKITEQTFDEYADDSDSEIDEDDGVSDLKKFKNSTLKKISFDKENYKIAKHNGKMHYVKPGYKAKKEQWVWLYPVDKADDLHHLVDKDDGRKLQEWIYDSSGKSVGYQTVESQIEYVDKQGNQSTSESPGEKSILWLSQVKLLAKQYGEYAQSLLDAYLQEYEGAEFEMTASDFLETAERMVGYDKQEDGLSEFEEITINKFLFEVGGVANNESKQQLSNKERKTPELSNDPSLATKLLLQLNSGNKEADKSTTAALADLVHTFDGSEAKVIARAFAQKMINDKHISFIGKAVKSTEELAVLSQVLRDPRFETFRYIFTNADGKIVYHTAVTSRLPHFTATSTAEGLLSYVNKEFSAAKTKGATGFYLLHNHPSGEVEVSPQDLNVTKQIKTAAKEINYQGHVVINSNTYAVIDENLNVSRNVLGKDPDALLTPDKPHVILNHLVQDVLDIVTIAKSMESEAGYSTLVFISTKRIVKGAQLIPSAYLDNIEQFKKILSEQAIGMGSPNVVLIAENDKIHAKSKILVENGYLLDSYSNQNKKSFAQDGVISKPEKDQWMGNSLYRAEETWKSSEYLIESKVIPFPQKQQSTAPTTRKDGKGHELMNFWYDALRKGEKVSLSDFKTAMKEYITFPALFKQDLSKNFKIDDLKKMVKFMHAYPADNKAGWVDRVYDDFTSSFMSMLKDTSGTFMESYSYDGGKTVSQQKIEKFNALIDSLTPEKFDEILVRNAEKHEQNKIDAKKRIESVKNPETIEEFELAGRVRKLTTEERRKYEDLKALSIKERNDSKQEASKTKEVKAATEIIEGKTEFTELVESKNTKSGETIFEFALADKIEKDDWRAVLDQVKKLGGGYWKGKFYFTVDTMAEAQSLMGTLKNGGKVEKASKEVDIPTKLRTVADNMQTAIDNAYGDRKENTARRAAQASNAREQGDHLKRIQAILNKIADALETKDLVYLSKIDSRAHIETLNSAIAFAKRPYVDAMVKKEFTDTNSYAAQMRHKELRGQKATIDTIDYATMPSFGKGTLQRVLEAGIKKEGMAREGEKLLRRLRTIDDLTYSKSKEYVDYVERAIKKGVSADYAENQLGDMKRLERMGINSDLQLRAALREYLPFYNSEGATAEELRLREVRARELKLTRTKIEGFFPTPKRIVSRMIELANIQKGDKILEPSAGAGHIADEIGIGKIDVVEYDRDLNQLLKDKGHNVIANDVFKAEGQYDKIIMNPPFERLQDIDHVRHVYDNLLKPNGRIVAIMSESPFFRDTKKAEEFREWLDEVGYSEKLPEGSFKDGDRSTGVATRIVVIDKPDVAKSDVMKDLENIGWAEKDGLKLKIVMSDGKTYDIEASTKAPGVGSYREFIAREYETWEDAAENVERILSSKSLIQDGIKQITPRPVVEKTVTKEVVKETPKPVDPNADPYAGIDAEKAEVYKGIYTAKAYEPRKPTPTEMLMKPQKEKGVVDDGKPKFQPQNIVSDGYRSNGAWALKKEYIDKAIANALDTMELREISEDTISKWAVEQKNHRDREITFGLVGFNEKIAVLADPETQDLIALNKNLYDYLHKKNLVLKQFGAVNPVGALAIFDGYKNVGIAIPLAANHIRGAKASDIVNLDNNYPPTKESKTKNTPDLTGFKKKEYTIKTDKGEMVVDGLIIGDYGINHKTHMVTHIPSGRGVSGANNQTHGKMIMKYLDLYMGKVDPDNLNAEQKKILDDIKDFSYREVDALLEGKGHSITAEKMQAFIDATQKSKPDAYVAWSSGQSIRNQYKSEGQTKIKPVHEIMNDIKRSFKVGITNTRFKNRKAYAHYKSFPQVIESKIVNTLEPLMHELGHHFDYRYKLNNAEMVKAMINKMPEEFLNNYTKDKHAKEAIAEFMRLYMTSPDDAMEFSSDFYELFEKTLSAEDLKNLQRIRTDVLNWLDGTIQQQIKSTMVSRVKTPRFTELKTEIMDKLNLARKKTYMFFFSELEPLKDFARFIEGVTGEKLAKDKDPYELAMYSLKSATIARSITVDNLQDTKGEIVGVSFQEILKEITMDDYDDFNAYLIAKRALDYHGRGKRTFSDDLPISYIENIVEDYERTQPKLKATAEKMYAWWQRFTEAWIVETGLIDADLYEHMKELEPHYVPFFRMRQEQTVIGDAVKQLSRRGYADHRNPIKRSSRDGSSDPIYYPIESMLAEIERYVTTVNRREVMLAVHDVYNALSQKGDISSGIGSIINRVAPRMKADSVDVKDRKLELTLKLYDEFAKTLSVGERMEFETIKKDASEGYATFQDMLDYLHKKGFNAMAIVDEVMDDTVLEFKPMDFDKEKNILAVKDRNGKTIHYEVYDRYLLEALLNNDTSNIDAATRVVSSIRRVTQTLITSWNPIFIAKNITKDSSQGFVASSIPMHKYHAELAKAIFDMLKNDEWAKRYRMAGGGFSGMVGSDSNALQATLADVVPGWKKEHKVKSFLLALEHFSDSIEQAPRLAEFKHIIQTKGDNKAGIIEALHAAQDVTVNFNRKGQIMRRWYGQLIPFFNPALQGLDKTVRMHGKEKLPTTVVRALVGVTLIKLLAYALNHDDEEYEKANKFIKDNNIMLPTGDGQFIRLPMAHGLGVLYGGGFERALEMVIKKDPDAWEGFTDSLVSAFMPPTESVVKPITDAKNNKTWYGGDIVPYDLQRVEKDQQYNDKTSFVAKQIAKIIPDSSNFSSPMVIDYLIDQYSGAIGKLATGRFGEYAVRSFTSDVAYSNSVVPKFYDRRKTVESAQATLKKGRVVKDEKLLNPILSKVYSGTAERISELNKLHDMIPTMNDAMVKNLSANFGKENLSRKEVQRLIKLLAVDAALEANRLYDKLMNEK